MNGRIHHWLQATAMMAMTCVSLAGKPVIHFTPNPDFSPHIRISTAGTATIEYLVTNQSNAPHTLTIQPVQGIEQVVTGNHCAQPFTLNQDHKSCILALKVDGNRLKGDVQAGPIVCEQGGNLLCYQPSPTDSLNIKKINATQPVVVAEAAPGGSIFPNYAQTAEIGSNLTFTATPLNHYQVDRWYVDGGVAQIGGSSFTLRNIRRDHQVGVSFTQSGFLYAACENGRLYFSENNGLNWSATETPPTNIATSVFATVNNVYVSGMDGRVAVSTNHGNTWSYSVRPDDSAINDVFVTRLNGMHRLYAGTNAGGVFYSENEGLEWTQTALSPSDGSAVNGLFVTSSNIIYTGNENGCLYFSTNMGESWTAIMGPQPGVAIRDVYVTDDTLYVNTADGLTFTSNDLTTGSNWALHAQAVYHLFVSHDARHILAGTQDGFVFSLRSGNELGFINYTKINGLFFLDAR